MNPANSIWLLTCHSLRKPVFRLLATWLPLVRHGKQSKAKATVLLSREARGNDVRSKATVILKNGGLARGLATRLPLVTERFQRKNGVNLGATTEGAKA